MSIRVILMSLLLCLIYVPKSFGSLTRTEMELRSKQVSHVEYKIDFDLSNSAYNPKTDRNEKPKLPTYRGKVSIQFSTSSKLDKISKELFLDFAYHKKGKIITAKINGTPYTPRWDKKQGKVYFLTSDFNNGEKNIIEIEFINGFTRKGKGFHRALDEEDKEVYLFTNLEAYYANEVFPLFDQPNLKATYELSTKVPNHWEVISNTREILKERVNTEITKWQFAKTQKFSSYLFALIAGPFKVWTPQYPTHIPMRLFTRKSVQKNIDPELWFNITKQSFFFYEKNYGLYPFQKYDQIVVPEITSGAMENVGAVTFNEIYLSTGGEYTPAQKTKLAFVMAHEMAHMWFGNLVTMNWWDDLWLNESFATFSSALVLEEIQKPLNLLNGWESFFSKSKSWGYREDSYSTTHPIVAKNVTDTDAAQSLFDGISYGKGSSVLKQLYYYIGKENFFSGVQNYLGNFKYSNATRKDFMDSLSRIAKINLNAWDKEWLQNQGTNTAQASLVQTSEESYAITLTPFKDPIDEKFRTHRTQIGVYDIASNGRAVLQKKIPVTYFDKPITVDTIIGVAPTFVFANQDDYDFSLENFDAHTVKELKANLDKLDDSLLKQQVYFSLFKMMRNGKISASDLITIVMNSLVGEQNLNVWNEGVVTLKQALRFLPREDRFHANNQIADFVKYRYEKEAEKDYILRRSLFRYFLSFASNKHLDFVSKTFHNAKSNSMKLNQDDRWFMIQALAKNNFHNVQSLIRAERLSDQSNKGKLEASIAYAKIPTSQSKHIWFEKLTTTGQIDSASSRSIAAHFQNILNSNSTQFVAKKYFSTILRLISEKEDYNKVAFLAASLYPNDANKQFILKTKRFIEEYNAKLPSKVRRTIIQKYEDAEKIQNSLNQS